MNAMPSVTGISFGYSSIRPQDLTGGIMACVASGYDLTEKLAETARDRVYRGRRAADGVSVVVKVLSEDATAEERARFRREFALLAKLDVPGVVKPHALDEEPDGSLAMILDDFGGTSLDRLVRRSRLSLEDVLELAIRIADAIGAIHRVRIVHKDINPSHIIFDPRSGRAALVGFGTADELPSRTVGLTPPSRLEGTLAYISPEQTGRMNRAVDYRTDFYSLGVTLYELLTGRLPFEAEDALGLVHCHIAKTPIAPHAALDAVPEGLSRVVMKLLAKMADDRYQSAWGLKSDLERCLREVRATGTIAPFELGLDDHSDQLRIPQKLVGRERETARLLEAFDRASAGARELLLVAGYAGVGKTSLVHETHRPIVDKRGYFVEGKFDQLQHSVPYFAWIQAFAGFVNYLLTESEAELAAWKGALLRALGNIGRVLTDVLPALELIIGRQPEVPTLGSAEAQNRFHYAFLELIKVVATSAHPLVIFLDDMQWIDAPSLSLLETLLGRREAGHVLVIGAYRDNEVSSIHPLMQGIDRLAKAQARIEILTLQDLGEDAVNALVADVLHSEPARTAPLARRIYSKTGGNPFFLLQALRSLVERGVVSFSVEERGWRWDGAELERTEISDNVVTLMLGKIQQLPAETQHVLRLAACMGFQFTASNLGLIAGWPEDRALDGLQPALREGLITPSDGGYRFVHDRVQQAAYSLIADADKKRVHLEIGRLLRQHLGDDDAAERLFAAVDQLDVGADLLEADDDKLELFRLNVRAGKKAKASAAFAVAARYFGAALRVRPARAWEEHHALVLAAHEESAECEYLSGRHEAADALLAEAVRHAQTPLERAGIHSIKVALYTAQARYPDSVAAGLSALRLLGLDLPDASDAALSAAAERALSRCREQLRSMDAAALLAAPDMQDPVATSRMGLLVQMALAAYFLNRTMYELLVATMIELTLRDGSSIGGALGYVLMAAISIAKLGDFEQAGALGRVSQALVVRYEAPTVKCKILQFYYNTVAPWFVPLREVVDLQRRALPADLEAGVPDDAINNLWGMFRSSLTASSLPLDEALGLCDDVISFAERAGEITFRDILLFIRLPVARMQGPPTADRAATDVDFDEEDANRRFEAIGALPTLAHHGIFKAWERYLAGDFEEAARYVESSARWLSFAADQPHTVYHYLHSSMLFLRGTPSAEALAAVSKNQDHLRRFAESCPQNFRHHQMLVEAERARAEGRVLEAMDGYDAAIDAAAENDCAYVEGLACERAAELWTGRKKPELAASYVRRGHRAYRRWRAWGKVRALEAAHPAWLEAREGDGAREKMSALDFDRVMRASHAISREMEMARLLDEVMRSALEIAGARTGCLLMETSGQWTVVASGAVEGRDAPRHPAPLDETEGGSARVVRFVARTLERIVLDDAASAGELVDEPHVRRARTKSLLCAPIMNRGKLAGILYLENDLTTHAFSSDRVQLLEVLLSQAATSLENASVYEALRESQAALLGLNRELEQRVAQRTAALESVNKELESFSYSVSHDLRAPLRAIEGFSQLLANKHKAGLDAEGQRYLRLVSEGAARMKRLIDDILAFSRSSRAALGRRTVDMSALAREVIHELRAAAPERSIRWVQGDLPPAECDRTMIRQVLTNLVGNAVKFTAGRTDAVIEISGEEERSENVYRVRDNGAGFDMRYAHKLFGVFERLHSAEEYDGTGIGLAIVKRVVERHGGRVWGEGRVDHGAEFCFTLPRAGAPSGDA